MFLYIYGCLAVLSFFLFAHFDYKETGFITVNDVLLYLIGMLIFPMVWVIFFFHCWEEKGWGSKIIFIKKKETINEDEE